MRYFVLISAFGLLGFFLFGTNASYSQTDLNEMSYLQFLDSCSRYNPSLWDSMSIEERLLSNLCDFVGKDFGEKQWNWLNGAKLDWESFAKNASENYAYKIPEFTDGGIKETLRVDSFISGRDSFPPTMVAMISFDYEKLSQVIHYDEKFTICIDGNLVPQESFIECSDEYVNYNFTKEEPLMIPKFAKSIPLPEHTRQQMLDWCQNSPKWAKIDKQFWDVVPTRILSTISEFESLNGQINSVEIHSHTSEYTCPPNVWMSGTFISENGDKHKFSLYHNRDFFRYNIDEIQCKNGLVLVTKSTDGSPTCVKPETKQKLIERGWAKSLGSVVSQKSSENILIPDNAVLQVKADAPCAWMTLQELPHSELLKQHDRTGRNALMLKIDDEDITKVPHLKEMLAAMHSESGFEPYEYDENTWEKSITSTESEQQQIWDWLKETSDSQFGQTTDSSFTTYFTYRDNYYHIIWALC